MFNTYSRLSQQGEQLSAFDKIHDHVEISPILEGTPKGDQEWMLYIAEHTPFIVGMLNLLHLDNLGLLEHLDGIKPLVVLRLN